MPLCRDSWNFLMNCLPDSQYHFKLRNIFLLPKIPLIINSARRISGFYYVNHTELNEIYLIHFPL